MVMAKVVDANQHAVATMVATMVEDIQTVMP